MRVRRLIGSFLVSGFCASSGVFGENLAGGAISNWSAPPAWERPSAGGGAATMGAITGPLPFVGVAPCRVADTRGNGFTGAYGPPSLAANAVRSFTIAGQCGIPLDAVAVSFNFAVLNVAAAGDLRVFPAGGAVPLVSTLNYNANTPNIANAAVVPLGSGGAITCQADAAKVDLIIDVNGYYGDARSGTLSVTTDQNAAAILGANTSATCVVECAVAGRISSGGNAVTGRAFVLGGASHGVYGNTLTQSDDGAGVFGLTGDPVPSQATYVRSGVRGESYVGYGVLGLSHNAGVGAALVNNAGLQLNYALLAAAGSPNYAVFAGGDSGGTGAKYFIEPHPADPSLVIRYVSLEGPEAGTYFRGRGRFQSGRAVIDIPEDFRLVTDPEGLGIQVTPIAEFASVAVVQIDLEAIVLKATRNVEFFYTVNGVRRTHKHLKPIGPGDEFRPGSANARIPAHLTEGQKAMLVSNGTYREDGSVNLETARRLGWDRVWEERGSPPSPR